MLRYMESSRGAFPHLKSVKVDQKHIVRQASEGQAEAPEARKDISGCATCLLGVMIAFISSRSTTLCFNWWERGSFRAERLL